MSNYHAQPFALTEKELREVAEFAKASGLDQIGRMAAELVALRSAYTTLATRHAKLLAELDKRPPAEKVYAKELDIIVRGDTGSY